MTHGKKKKRSKSNVFLKVNMYIKGKQAKLVSPSGGMFERLSGFRITLPGKS